MIYNLVQMMIATTKLRKIKNGNLIGAILITQEQ